MILDEWETPSKEIIECIRDLQLPLKQKSFFRTPSPYLDSIYETEHIGYFVLLDETGKPLNTEFSENNLSLFENK